MSGSPHTWSFPLLLSSCSLCVLIPRVTKRELASTVSKRPPADSLATGPSSSYTVVPLTDIVHAMELVPMFETAISGIELSKDSCLEAYEQYYLNSFADKESFNVIC